MTNQTNIPKPMTDNEIKALVGVIWERMAKHHRIAGGHKDPDNLSEWDMRQITGEQIARAVEAHHGITTTIHPEPAQPSGNAGDLSPEAKQVLDDLLQWVFAHHAWSAMPIAVARAVALQRTLAAQAQPPVSQPVKCGHCGGTGQTCTGTIDGTPELFDCRHCGGTGDVSGEYPGVACPACYGTGKAPQPAEPEDGEEIMVNAAHDVYTLPLQPSGLSSGPRFVVHVPWPEQAAAKDAEIEALRAEVVSERNLKADAIHACALANIRAERLAEALQSLLRYVERCREAGVLVCDDIGPEEFARYELEQALSLPPEQPAAVDEAMVFRLAVWMATQDGHDDPHRMIWEGSPPEPWGEVWNRYEYDARAALTAAIASAPQPSFDRRFADMLTGILGDVQDELGFTDEEKLCANGSAEIVAAIRELKERAASQQPAAPSGAAASAEPAVWVAADTLNSPHPTCISSLAYMSQLDRERGREYVPLYAAPVAAQKEGDARDAAIDAALAQEQENKA